MQQINASSVQLCFYLFISVYVCWLVCLFVYLALGYFLICLYVCLFVTVIFFYLLVYCLFVVVCFFIYFKFTTTLREREREPAVQLAFLHMLWITKHQPQLTGLLPWQWHRWQFEKALRSPFRMWQRHDRSRTKTCSMSACLSMERNGINHLLDHSCLCLTGTYQSAHWVHWCELGLEWYEKTLWHYNCTTLPEKKKI